MRRNDLPTVRKFAGSVREPTPEPNSDVSLAVVTLASAVATNKSLLLTDVGRSAATKARLVQSVPSLIIALRAVPGARVATALVPLPIRAACAASVAAPVPPPATGSVLYINPVACELSATNG